MKIQFFSDLHLEFGGLELARSDADVIVAAGDIGVGLEGVQWLRELGKPVIYVTGNHEYYGGDLAALDARIDEATRGTAVHFLNNRTVIYCGVRFLGTTLWSDFHSGDPDSLAFAAEHMNDYYCIEHDEGDLAPEILLDLHRASRRWLEAELAVPFDGRTVIVSHHAPTYRSWFRPDRLLLRGAYCSDLSELTRRYHIDLWIHGHIHAVADYCIGGARVVSNPRGYTGLQEVRGFDAARAIAFD
ncbi:MAG: metallophosphoesterase [Gammaproteobacteria bacterium]|nr:metallophosphoesterase [Gammaproteobacteria bacterium]MBI5618843.1 metallophosphoesterase [Gammaproteobacteria bacterium]